jgi:hypothetical protein
MITPPGGWTVHRRGDELVLAAAGRRATLRYVERLRPLARIAELVAAARRPAGFHPDGFEPVRTLVTHEGEYASLVFVSGRLGARPVELGYGFVLLDDHYARLTSLAAGEDAAAVRLLVEELLVNDTHLLGRVRRRRYAYASPPGWQPVSDVFATTWYRQEPGVRSRICIAPALPRHPGVVARTLAKLIRGIERLRRVEVAPVRTVRTPTLSGNRWHLRDVAATGLDSHVLFLQDRSFLYPARLDAPPGAHAELDQFETLVQSIEPIPAGARVPRATHTLAAQWAE